MNVALAIEIWQACAELLHQCSLHLC